MAKRGRKEVPCPDPGKLADLVNGGSLGSEICNHFEVGRKALYRWLGQHGLPQPRRMEGKDRSRKGRGSIYTSQGRTWQALNTQEKIDAACTPKKLATFWAKVKKTETCWVWIGSVHQSRGYGQSALGGFNMHAHRVAWMIRRGVIPADVHVLHRCDNPLCVRPDHLFLGTNQDNYDDRDRKGRVAHGERHTRAKLTADLVRQIRASSESDATWAKRLGVWPTTITYARDGTHWKRLN